MVGCLGLLGCLLVVGCWVAGLTAGIDCILAVGWAEGIGCMLGCLHAGLVGQLLGCRPCDALLFPSLRQFPSLLRRFPSLLLLFPSLLLRRPVSLGPLSGFARRLQSPVEAGTPARRRSEGTLFLKPA